MVVIDNEIARSLNIDGNTFLEQLLTDDGILMKIRSMKSNEDSNVAK
jgi:hypothetical protein